MINDLSLLIVKPECFDRVETIQTELNKRGFLVLKKYHKTDFSNAVKLIYCKDFKEEILEVFSNAYIKNNFGDDYYVFLVKYINGGTVQKLIDEVGSSRGYLTEPNNSLRSQFGLKKTYLDKNTGFEVIFNGFHKVDSTEELLFQIKALNLEPIKV